MKTIIARVLTPPFVAYVANVIQILFIEED